MMCTAAGKRYNRRVILLSLLYAIFFLIAVYCFKHKLVPGSGRFVLALFPALPIIGIFFAMGRYLLEEQDEYVRMLMIRQTLFATGFALSAATIWGFLKSFDLVDRVDGYWIVIVWFAGLGLGRLINFVTLGESAC